MKEQENISLLTDASFSVSISSSGSLFEGGHYTVLDDENYENNTQDNDCNGLSIVNAEVNEGNIVTSSRVSKLHARMLFSLNVKNSVYFYKVTIARNLLPPKMYFDIAKRRDKREWYQAYNKEVSSLTSVG
eukprot:snap_masked-scaffold_14-processed-gene-7.51-mRNA-1 protein AED:1.00 eAED:1.00 QI:0/-1/0/0/-1/1/1/0/130